MSSSSSTGRRIFLVAGIAFAVVAIAYGVVTVVSLLSDRSTTDRAAYSSEIKRVVVEVTGDVRILGVDENVTTVERRLRWSLARPRITEDVVGGTLTIRARCGFSLRSAAAPTTSCGFRVESRSTPARAAAI